MLRCTASRRLDHVGRVDGVMGHWRRWRLHRGGRWQCHVGDGNTATRNALISCAGWDDGNCRSGLSGGGLSASLTVHRRWYSTRTTMLQSAKKAGGPASSGRRPEASEGPPPLAHGQRQTTDAKDNEQRKEAMIHLARRTAALAAELTTLKNAVESAEAIAKQAVQVTARADQRVHAVEAHCTSLAAKLEHVTLLASQSELRWKQHQALLSAPKSDRNKGQEEGEDSAPTTTQQGGEGGVARVGDPQTGRQPAPINSSSSSSSSSAAVVSTAAGNSAPEGRAMVAPVVGNPAQAAAMVEPQGTKGVGCYVVDPAINNNNHNEEVHRRLLARIEGLSAAVAALQQHRVVQQQQSSRLHPAHSTRVEEQVGAPKGNDGNASIASAAAPRSSPSQPATDASVDTSMTHSAAGGATAAAAEMVPLRASIGATGHVHVVGAQVVVRNIPGNVSANTIRTWCSTVGQVASVLVVRPPRGGWSTVASGGSGEASRMGRGTLGHDAKSMLVTFASVNDANDAVQRLNGFVWSGSSPSAGRAGVGRAAEAAAPSSPRQASSRIHRGGGDVGDDEGNETGAAAMSGALVSSSSSRTGSSSVLIVEHFAMYDVAAEVSLMVGVRRDAAAS